MKNKKTLVAFILTIAFCVSIGTVGAISVYVNDGYRRNMGGKQRS